MQKPFRCLLHNALDLFVFLEKYDGNLPLLSLSELSWQNLKLGLTPNKPLHQVKGLSEIYKSENPDLLLLVEVGGYDSLKNLNEFFLNNEYSVFHAPSNSDRGIDVGFLLKKEFHNDAVFHSYTENILGNGEKFKRGVFELELNINSKNITFLLTHLKSPLDPHKIDPDGKKQRTHEILELKNIYKKIREEKKHSKIFLCGDFNTVSESEEFSHLRELGLKDALDFALYPPHSRATFMAPNGKTYAPLHQIDFVLGTSEDFTCFNHKETKLIPFPPSKSPLSDHFPYIFEFNL